MTTSLDNDVTDNDAATSPNEAGGAFADALTLVRFAVTPLVMALIIWQWPDPQVAILASFLFIIAALSDIFDDYFGGAARSAVRRLGYLDDVADTVLIVGVLTALSIVLWQNGLFHWAFAVPVIILILREVVVGLFKGYELSRYGWPDNILSNLKAGLSMLGTVLLVGAPWLTQMLDRLRAGSDNAMAVYDTVSPAIWIIGQGFLWLAMIASLLSGYKILTHIRDEEVSDP